jgi:hypothetical protein
LTQQADDRVAMPAIEGEGMAAARRLDRGSVPRHVRPQVAAEQGCAAVVVVAAEEQGQHAVASGAVFDRGEQCRADTVALTVGRHDQRMDLPAAIVGLDRADPADQPLAVEGGVAQPVLLVTPQFDLGLRLARRLIAGGQGRQRVAQNLRCRAVLRGVERLEVDENDGHSAS